MSADRLTDALLDALKDGGGVGELCEAAAAVLGRPVVVLSADRRVVASGGVVDAHEARDVVQGATLAAALAIDGGIWGGVSIPLREGDEPHRLEEQLRRLGGFLELELGRSGVPTPAREQAPRRLMLDLLHDRLADAASLIVRARALDVAFDEGARFVALAIAADAVSGERIRAGLATSGAVALSARLPEARLVLASVPTGIDSDGFARRLGRAVLPARRDALGTLISIGSPARNALGAGRALRTALDGLAVARIVGEGPAIVTSLDTALARLLNRLAEGSELRETVEEVLAPLEAAEGVRAGTLLTTLEIVLERPASKADAARRLGIRRQSLYRRIERLEEALGSLDDPDRRLLLQVAIRARRVLGAGPNPDRLPAAA
jgi:purine catabolism regulator